MKTTTSVTLGFVSFASTVFGHGFVTDPQARMPGSAMEAACGNQVEINQSSDNYGNIQGELQVASSQSDYDEAACDIWLCKGYKFADNTANVQSLTAGQVLPITVDIRAPHTGVANVSIVKTSSNTVIGSPLISWDVYASTATSIPANETQFDITIPSDLGSECATAGDCVIQWYWNAASIDQTYESCIDFTVSGSGSGGDDSSASASQTTSATATSTAAALTSTVAAETTSVDTTTSSAAAETSTAADQTTAAAETSSTVVVETSSATTSVAAETSAVETTPAATSATTFATVTKATSTKVVATSSAAASPSGTAALYGQCGGKNWTGATSCSVGTCTGMNPYYSQCVNA
ncbi:Uu.00g075460.m01.CDS01 [Anthostomella pinea]|uniref:Uu.00g075460.m01.CDS01 n=1 Tax=Anthostomella pinea TaxID=933095 RepID=A0AAI8VQ10_9PEZI|nr:Uu.00g075460.m01.CDS01 [Anthostomella pinea]